MTVKILDYLRIGYPGVIVDPSWCTSILYYRIGRDIGAFVRRTLFSPTFCLVCLIVLFQSSGLAQPNQHLNSEDVSVLHPLVTVGLTHL